MLFQSVSSPPMGPALASQMPEVDKFVRMQEWSFLVRKGDVSSPPPDSATPREREGFFRDFNHHFNVMITPHEILPGHYLQLKVAARSPRKVRALFPDGVYVEGWGTFCERILLDLGWGGPLDRLAQGDVNLVLKLEGKVTVARVVVEVSGVGAEGKLEVRGLDKWVEEGRVK